MKFEASSRQSEGCFFEVNSVGSLGQILIPITTCVTYPSSQECHFARLSVKDLREDVNMDIPN